MGDVVCSRLPMSGRQQDLLKLDRTGQLIGDRYEVLEPLDKGGQASVYKARDRIDGDLVAIKILNESREADAAGRERMFREARALATLVGTAAVRVLDQQWTQDGALCLVMELLHGQDLEEWLGKLEGAGARFPVAALSPIIDPVVLTLERAHAQGILHRDLKPANIFIVDKEYGGGVKLLDFGFAKFTRLPSFTEQGFVAGSPSYIAPETWMGNTNVDARIDVYALGAIVFRVLAGQAPFTAPHLGKLLQLATTAQRPSLHALRPDLPPAIDAWVAQALAIEPDERFLTVRALWQALRSILFLA